MRFKLVWLFSALLISGCASIYDVKPQIALIDVRLGEVNLFETDLNTIIRIDNEGRNSLCINGGVFRLFLNDINIGRGMIPDSFTVPGLESVTRPVLFRLYNLTLISRLQSLLESDQFSYKLSGYVYICGVLGLNGKIPVEHKGSLDVK